MYLKRHDSITVILAITFCLAGTMTVLGQSGHATINENELNHLHYEDRIIVMDIPVPAGCRGLALRGNHQSLVVRTWDQPGIRLVRKVSIDSLTSARLTNQQLQKELKIKASSDRDSIQIDLGLSKVPQNFDILVTGSVKEYKRNRPMQGIDSNDPNHALTIAGAASTRKADTAATYGMHENAASTQALRALTTSNGQPEAVSIPATGHIYTLEDIQQLSAGSSAISPTGSGLSLPAAEEVILWIPRTMALRITATACVIKSLSDLEAVSLVCDNSYLYFNNVHKLEGKSRSSDIVTRNIGNANIDMRGGKLVTGDIDTLAIRSQMAELDSRQIKRLIVSSSSSDNYSIDIIGYTEIKKQFGSLHIGTLQEGATVDCSNTDIIIREVPRQVNRLSIQDRYAVVYVGLSMLDHLDLSVKGASSTLSVPDSVMLADAGRPDQGGLQFRSGSGRNTGRPTVVSIDCPACSINLQ
jgi:hypothetical protein